MFQPYPGTKVYEYCVEPGYVEPGTERFESIYTEPVLQLGEEEKRHLVVLQRLLALLVNYPRLQALLPLFYRLPAAESVLAYVFRFYYGYRAHKYIYGAAAPLIVRLRAAVPMLFSRNRI